jgi:hypothetical protein
MIIALLLVADEPIASTTDLISSALDASREQAIYSLQLILKPLRRLLLSILWSISVQYMWSSVGFFPGFCF